MIHSLKNLRSLLQEGPPETFLVELKTLLNSHELSPEDFAMLGKMALPVLSAQKSALKISLLGQCTTTWLGYHLATQALKHGRCLDIHDAEYDTVLQSLLETEDNAADFFVFLPWNQRILHRLRNGDDFETVIDGEISFWRQIWQLAGQKGGRIIQIGYDYIGPGPLGYHCSTKPGGAIDTLREMNRRLRLEMPGGAFFVDLETISGELGRREFYSTRQYYWTKNPFGTQGADLLAERVDNAIRTLLTGSKKVLVLDLDNTLWGGVVGDLGPLDIELGEGPDGEAFRDFQAFCKELSKRGVLLAVASKNNEADAKEPFEKNPNMVLKLDDTVSFQAHWMPKSGSIKTIAAELNLGVDSLVFFDDNPAEREEVRQNAPDVCVVDVPDDPSDYIKALENSLFFETLTVTAADVERTVQYKIENQRKSFENSFTNLDDYLASLEMVGKIAPVHDGNMQRVVQLLGKTNQFNVTTKRHDEAAIRNMLALPGAFGMTLELSDKFGQHGPIAVALCVPTGDVGELFVDTFLMSCRVINRTAEQFFMNALVEKANEAGFHRILGEYVKTAKNGLVENLFPKLGFETVKRNAEYGFFRLTSPFVFQKTWVQPKPSGISPRSE